MDKQCIWYYIKTRSLLGLNATQIHEELTTAYGQEYISYRTFARWHHAFSSGQESLEDDPRSVRPITVVTQDNITAVKDLVNDNSHISIDCIADVLDISHGSVHTILKEHLQLRKVFSKWVPHFLTQEQRQRRVNICTENLKKFENGEWRLCDIITGDGTWVYHRKIASKQQSKAWVVEGERPTTVVRRQPYEKITMFVIFFMTNGLALVHQVPPGVSINGIYYRDECLKPLVKNLLIKRPSSETYGIKLHHDNSRPHVEDVVINYLQDEKIEVMAHPPFSPDLAPSDFWLFTYLSR